MRKFLLSILFIIGICSSISAKDIISRTINITDASKTENKKSTTTATTTYTPPTQVYTPVVVNLYTGWLQLPDTHWVYMINNQYCPDGWQIINNQWYYFTNHILLQNQYTPDGYWVNNNGEWDQTIKQDKNKSGNTGAKTTHTGKGTAFYKLEGSLNNVNYTAGSINLLNNSYKHTYKFDKKGELEITNIDPKYTSLDFSLYIKNPNHDYTYELYVYLDGAEEDCIDTFNGNIQNYSIKLDEVSKIKFKYFIDTDGDDEEKASSIYLYLLDGNLYKDDNDMYNKYEDEDDTEELSEDDMNLPIYEDGIDGAWHDGKVIGLSNDKYVFITGDNQLLTNGYAIIKECNSNKYNISKFNSSGVWLGYAGSVLDTDESNAHKALTQIAKYDEKFMNNPIEEKEIE